MLMNTSIDRLMERSEYLQEHASSFLSTAHFRIHFLHAGSGLPMILIHGGGVWLYSIRHNIVPLSEISCVYALDMPGYGFTGIVNHALPMGLDTMTLAVREFMDGLHIDKATLVGHSWGGGWALAYALACPERVDRIVLIDSSGLDVPDVPEWELLKMPVIGGILLRFLTADMVRKRLELSFAHKDIVDDAMAREVYLPMKIPANRKAQTLLARNLSWSLIEKRLDKLDHRVLLIWGEQDRYLDVGLAKRFKEKIRNIRVEIIRDCGHSAHEEAPDKVNRFIIEFLQ